MCLICWPEDDLAEVELKIRMQFSQVKLDTEDHNELHLTLINKYKLSELKQSDKCNLTIRIPENMRVVYIQSG